MDEGKKYIWTVRTYRIVEIADDGVVVESKDGTIQKLKILIPKFAVVGDLIRYAEHNIYDVIDENGDFVYR